MEPRPGPPPRAVRARLGRPRAARALAACSLALFLGAACGGRGEEPRPGHAAPPREAAPAPDRPSAAAAEEAALLHGTPHGAWSSRYRPRPSHPTLLRGAVVMTAAGEELEGADVLLAEGRIAAIGRGLEAPEGAEVVDAAGRFVTPGLIDTHSHLGVSPTPEVAAHFDNNEVGATTPEAWIEHAIWPQGPGFARALAAGVTVAQLLPGSGDLIEGRGATVKLVPARTAQEMLFPDAPRGLKMACGENPKRGRGFPETRMGNVAGWRRAFIRARPYRERWDRWLGHGKGERPERDLGLETLAEALRGRIPLHVHCYRADDMAAVLELADEFGLEVRSFHHAVEAYKIRDLLAERGIAASMWSDWWGFKMEALDGIPENVALVSAAGAPAIVHSDSDLGIQLLAQEAAKAMRAGRRAGIPVSRDEALRWITANPARALGIDDRVGSLEPGKHADVVLWSGDPFSVYSRVDRVWIDGAPAYDRTEEGLRPVSDFEVGLLPPAAAEPGVRPQLVSPLGRPLRPLPDTAAALAPLRAALAVHPDSVGLLLDLGRVRAAAWRYREAVEAYDRAIARRPEDPRPYRHRGHRYISLRRFDEAAADLERAARLLPERGAAGEGAGEEATALAFDVHYHLGLARYLEGEWEAAARAWQDAFEASADDDARVAAAYWRWLSLARAGSGEEAAALASRIREDMAVEENVAYHRLLLLFGGRLPVEEVAPGPDADPLDAATLGYGVGAWRLIRGDRDRAEALFREIVRGPYWPAFGFIAAETELARAGPP